ncbi:MAG TPA: dipeptidyl aminopeptidase, partial [Streptosporangiaceae bacterium]|nr:dipeptidyl aminopeptidase [Streptosporangiaceae bacterium]
MKFLFNDQSFSFETLRALGYAVYGGADIGEVVSTAGRIPDGDETAWYTQWRALAERIHAAAERSAAAG